MVTSQFRAVARKTSGEIVREALRDAILNGELPGGTPLAVAELAERFGTSRTPVREALQTLAVDGLVDFRAYRSAVVHPASEREAREIYELRLVLEPLGAETSASNITAEELAHARSLHRQMLETTDTAEWVALNHAFHETLSRPTQSVRLRMLLDKLRQESAIQVAASIRYDEDRVERGNREHSALLEAYEAHDCEAAKAAISAHLQTTISAILQHGSDLCSDPSSDS